MVNHTLRGNCEPCDACALRREALEPRANDFGPITDHRHIYVECNECGGHGLKPILPAEIIRRTCEEARRLYWPAFDRRIEAQAIRAGRHPAIHGD